MLYASQPSYNIQHAKNIYEMTMSQRNLKSIDMHIDRQKTEHSNRITEITDLPTKIQTGRQTNKESARKESKKISY